VTTRSTHWLTAKPRRLVGVAHAQQQPALRAQRLAHARQQRGLRGVVHVVQHVEDDHQVAVGQRGPAHVAADEVRRQRQAATAAAARATSLGISSMPV
jgi:hypothetical protein